MGQTVSIGFASIFSCFVLIFIFAFHRAEDRAHRIGQEQEVSVYRLLATGTIDESIYAVQQEKLALHNDVLQEGAPAAADDDADEKPADVKNLLARYFEGVK